MKIVSCYKLVPDEGAIAFNKNGVDASAAEWQIGQYDLCAVEVGAQIAEKDAENKFYALTVGGDIVENSKLKKSILSRGPQEMVAVKDAAFETADSYAMAEALAAEVKALGDVDLVLFGEGSGDMYAQQTGILTGAILGWNTVNAVSKLEVVDGAVVVERKLEDCVEVVKVALPAAVSVTSDICLPRLASMKEILKAGKKPSTIKSLADAGVSGESKVETVSVAAVKKTARDCEVVAGDDAGIEQLVLKLRKFM